MTLQIINSTTAGATQDLSSRVFMASERLGLPPFSITQSAEEGAVAHSTLVVDDPSGNLTLKGHRRVYFVETEAPAGSQVIGNTYVGTKEISRGDWRVGPLARTFSVSLQDANTLISRRLIVGADGNRPAETDVQRVQWLMGTTEANEFNGSSTYINTSGAATDMDAVDYRGQSVTAILSDCSQASHKNWWVIYEESLGEFSLWYDWDYSETYDSTIRLSNDETDIDDSVTFAYFPTAILSQDPSRVYSGTLIDFLPANATDPTWVYETLISTGNEFVFRDVAYPSQNVKTEGTARARANKYNSKSDEEDDVVKVSFVVPSASVNKLMHGMRIEAKGTHWAFTGGNDYTSFSWMRCLNRTVTQLAPTHYRIDATLSPIPPPPNEQYGDQITVGGYAGWQWPEGQPTEGQLLIEALAQRADSSYEAAIVPIGTNQLGTPAQNVAGTGSTYIAGVQTQSVPAANRYGYPITMAWREAGANEPVLAHWGMQGTALSGSSGPHAHFAEIAITPGAPSVQVSQGDIVVTGATFTSPNITTTGAGYIFGIMGYNCSGPADGSSSWFTMTANAASTHILTQGFQQGSFGGYSVFFYRFVSGAGTYNVAFTRSAAPRAGTDYSFIMGFWAASAATAGFPA